MNEIEKKLLIKLKQKVFDLEIKLKKLDEKVENIQDYLEGKFSIERVIKL